MVGTSILRAAAAVFFTALTASALETITDCKLVVYTSYGNPTWIPDPLANVSTKSFSSTESAATTTAGGWKEWDPSTSTSTKVETPSATVALHTWSDWDPATATSATSAATAKPTDEAYTWSEWDPTTSTKATTTSTGSEGWGEWAHATSTITALDCDPTVVVEICDEEDGSESTYTHTEYPKSCAETTASLTLLQTTSSTTSYAITTTTASTAGW